MKIHTNSFKTFKVCNEFILKNHESDYRRKKIVFAVYKPVFFYLLGHIAQYLSIKNLLISVMQRYLNVSFKNTRRVVGVAILENLHSAEISKTNLYLSNR